MTEQTNSKVKDWLTAIFRTEEIDNYNSWTKLLFFLIAKPRGWLGIFIVLAILIAAMHFAIKYVFKSNNVEYINLKGTISFTQGNTQDAVLLLSPNGGDESTPWVETGIEVKQNDVIKITASGRVNCAIKRVIAQTIRPEIDEQTWSGPIGLPKKKNITSVSHLSKAKLLPDKEDDYYGFGMLLAAVRDSRDSKEPLKIKEEDMVPFKPPRQDDDDDFVDFIKFTAKTDGEIVLTVNDIWLDSHDEKFYAAPLDKHREYYEETARFDAAFRDEDFDSWPKEKKKEKLDELYKTRSSTWKSIKQQENWNTWYQDNIGSFSVSITVNPKTK